MASQQELDMRMEQLSLTGLGADFTSIMAGQRTNTTGLPSVTQETLQSPERPKLRLTKVAVLSGPSYSGKDGVMQILAQRHGWTYYDGTIDNFERRGERSGSPIERERRAHIDFDAKQARRFAELKPGDPMWIHQTRLGGIILASEIDKRNAELARQNWQMQNGEVPENPIEPIPAVSILLWTSTRVREARAVKHEQELAQKEGRRIPTRKHILALMRKKQLDETRSWRKRFGTIDLGPNPFSRFLKRRNGQPVYNRYVNTDDLTLEQVADKVEKLLLQLGAVELIESNPHGDQSGVGVEMTEGTPVDIDKSIATRVMPELPKYHPSRHMSDQESVA